MKLKIKIMKQRPEISDEEIRSYMNFQELLGRQSALHASRGRSWKNAIKWTLFTAAVISVPFIYYHSINQKSGTTSPMELKETSSESRPQLTEETALDTMSAELEESMVTTGKIETIETTKSEFDRLEDKPSDVAEEGEKASNPIYIQAEPIDGYDFLYKYFNENLEYPVSAIPDSIQGVVVVSFVIDKLGKPVQIEFIESLGEPFEIESRRLIENMPPWKPAQLGGKRVDSKMTLPITFQVKEVNKNQK